MANRFVVTEPLRGWRALSVSNQRTRLDFAHCVREVVERHYPLVDRIVLIMDQLNTHSPASLSTAFPPDEAKRLADKLEIHLTPKHGSWLNMAELERIVLQRQCLRQRLPSRAAMEREVGAWSRRSNDQITRVDWQCTTDDARTNFRRLYPAFED